MFIPRTRCRPNRAGRLSFWVGSQNSWASRERKRRWMGGWCVGGYDGDVGHNDDDDDDDNNENAAGEPW